MKVENKGKRKKKNKSTEICQENTRGSKELKSNSGTIC